MAVYEVNYDLRKPGKNYDDLIKELTKFASWCHFLKSSWFVVSDQTSSQVHAQLWARMDGSDGLVVSEVRKGNSAWSGLAQDISDWMKENL